MKSTLGLWWLLLLSGSFGLAIGAGPVRAELVPDGSLGPEASTVTPGFVRGGPAELIQGGAARGASLFHSFREFNVLPEQRVYFANPVGIETILSRVTGGNLSRIDGLLGVDGGASLFLLNPNGIVFGPGARLDVAGSFVGTTARSLRWADGQEFSAVEPQGAPLLSVQVAPGLQWGSAAGRIANQGQLQAGQNLTLAAGQLDLQGQLQAGQNLTLLAQSGLKVRDSGTQPFVAAAGQELRLQGNEAVDIFALNHPGSVLRSGGDLILRSNTPVIGDARYWSGGSMRIETLAGVPNDFWSPNDPIVIANGDFTAGDYTGASLHILAGGSVRLGRVRITGADSLTAIGPTTNAALAPVTLGDGTTVVVDGVTRPTLDVRAGINWLAFGGPPANGTTGSPTFVSPGPTFSTPTPPDPLRADIEIGPVSITAPNGMVLLTNRYQLNPPLNGNIQVGNIDTSSTIGPGGDVMIDSRGTLDIIGTTINTAAVTGGAGDIKLLGRQRVLVDGATIAAPTTATGAGNAGAITIQGGDVLIQNNSRVLNGALGRGSAGEIRLQAERDVLISNSTVASRQGANSPEPGGRLTLQAANVTLQENANVGTDSASASASGPVTVRASLLTVDGSRLVTNGTGTAPAGTLSVTADNVQLLRGGRIGTTSAAGVGGDLRLDVRRQLILRQGSSITTTVGVNGAGGSGGNLTLNAGAIVASDNSDIVTKALQGTGGQITLNASRLDNIQLLTSLQLQQRLGLDVTGDVNQLNPQALTSNEIVALRALVPLSVPTPPPPTPDPNPDPAPTDISGPPDLTRKALSAAQPATPPAQPDTPKCEILIEPRDRPKLTPDLSETHPQRRACDAPPESLAPESAEVEFSLEEATRAIALPNGEVQLVP